MVSIAPTPLYLPTEEANKIFKSPIPQRREFAYSSNPALSSGSNSPSSLATTSVNCESNASNHQEVGEKQPYHTQANPNLINHSTLARESSSSELSYFIGPKLIKSKTYHHQRFNHQNQHHHHHHHNNNNNYHQQLKTDHNQKSLIEKTISGICKYSPILSEGNGLGGGVYFLKSQNGRKVSVFKPKDEENGIVPVARGSSSMKSHHNGLKNGTVMGEGIYKEVAAYLFDQRLNGYFGVPTTTLVEVYHPHWKDENGVQIKKIGSLQEFIDFDDSAEEVGCSKFSVSDVHRIGLLDCLLFNCDRHSGNILVEYDDEDKVKLTPIDHSLCLPSSNSLSDAWFDWINFPQSKVPFDKTTRDLILSIDIDSEIRYLRNQLPELRVQCLETLKITTTFIQKAIRKNLTLHQIGKIISRFSNLDQPSALENILNHVVQVKENRISLNNQIFWFDYSKEIDSFLNNNNNLHF